MVTRKEPPPSDLPKSLADRVEPWRFHIRRELLDHSAMVPSYRSNRVQPYGFAAVLALAQVYPVSATCELGFPRFLTSYLSRLTPPKVRIIAPYPSLTHSLALAHRATLQDLKDPHLVFRMLCLFTWVR